MNMNEFDDMHLADVANFDFGKEAKKYYPIAADQAEKLSGSTRSLSEAPVSAAPNNERCGVGNHAETNQLPQATSERVPHRSPNKEAEIARRMAIAQTWLDTPMSGFEETMLEELILDYRARLEKWEPLTRDTYEHDFEGEQREELERLIPRRER